MVRHPRRAACVAACLIAGLLACLADARPALAETFPSRAVKLIVPVPPGGSTDAVARMLALRMQAILGQPAITENQPGAGGIVAARAVAAARPDGYTLLISGIGGLAITPMAKTPEFNAATAFTLVATVATETMVVAVNPKVPGATLDEFLRYVRAHPGTLNYGAAPGIVPHFVSEFFKLKAGADIVHIPYKGAGPAITDLLAGQIDMMVNTKSLLLPLVRSGRLRALAVTSGARWPELPQVPTLVEAGIFPYPLEVWWGIVGPAGMPPDIVVRLNAAINASLTSSDLRTSFGNLGIEPRISTPKEFAALLADDAPRWLDIIRVTGIKLE
jgi:tripartite-type tricarboxylate transporter receptor subunit TctC